MLWKYFIIWSCNCTKSRSVKGNRASTLPLLSRNWSCHISLLIKLSVSKQYGCKQCVWERTETDVMVTQKDTHSLRQSTPQCLAHRICLSLVVCFSRRCVRLESWMTYGQWFNDKSLCVSVCVREMREYSLR